MLVHSVHGPFLLCEPLRKKKITSSCSNLQSFLLSDMNCINFNFRIASGNSGNK